jgi:hypothetical protein
MGKININDLDDYLSDDADYEVEQKIKHKRKKSSIYNNNTNEQLDLE